MTWQKSKSIGDEAEEQLAEVLRECYGGEILRTTGPASYDLLILHRVEVKRDLRTESGRVAVETGRGGSPSGLSTSTADWWAILIKAEGGRGKAEEALLIRTNELRALVENYPPVRGGDGNKSWLRLVPLAELRRAAKLVSMRHG